jgi:hypothetical protein
MFIEPGGKGNFEAPEERNTWLEKVTLRSSGAKEFDPGDLSYKHLAALRPGFR